MTIRFTTATFAAAAALWVAPAPAPAFTLFSATGDAATIAPTVDAFRDALGALNPFTPDNFVGGRRQIDWDAAPDAVSDPNPFPGDFFNFTAAPRARGIEFSTPGDGFLLSATAASGTPPGFGLAADGIVPFSPERVFTPVGSTLTTVAFFDPADTDAPARVAGLGVVFVDVEVAGAATFEVFDLSGASLFASDVPVAGEGLFSFLGVLFDVPVIAGAELVTGTSPLLGTGVAPVDGVVMDDFIFGEPTPVPLPAAGALLAAALALAAAGAGRRARRG